MEEEGFCYNMKMVMVEWDDSYTEYGWNQKEYYKEIRPTYPVSIGVLVVDNKECITLIQTLSNSQYTGSITIPRGCIKRIRYLKVA